MSFPSPACECVYLIQSNEVFKVGHTRNLKNRLQYYKTHNPHFKLLSFVKTSRSRDVETNVLKDLKKNFQLLEGTREWFEGHLHPEIFSKIAHSYARPEEEHLEIHSVLANTVIDFLEGKGIPVESLLTYWIIDGCEDWREYLSDDATLNELLVRIFN